MPTVTPARGRPGLKWRSLRRHEGKDTRIERIDRGQRSGLRHQGFQNSQEPLTEEPPDRSGNEPEDQALDQHLSHQASPSGTEGGTHDELVASG